MFGNLIHVKSAYNNVCFILHLEDRNYLVVVSVGAGTTNFSDLWEHSIAADRLPGANSAAFFFLRIAVLAVFETILTTTN